ncbi:MAG: hypothetical protein ACI97N_000774 [Cognaticolwellia sp.]|jgi:hypothetical protein|tara:strand:+ start:700 stop:810 length:111 start_codon:yes stop_codon:yes gene_type:complete
MKKSIFNFDEKHVISKSAQNQVKGGGGIDDDTDGID